LLALPPVDRGHADAGEDPGLAGADVAVAVALGRTVAVGSADVPDVGLSDREAVGFGVAVGEEATSG
jgi:hypothetical protein